MADAPIPLSSASALSSEEREEREAFERKVRTLSEADLKEQAQQDLVVWRGVGKQLLTMVESDLLHERRVRSARISELMGAVVEALRGDSFEVLHAAIGALSSEVWGTDPEPDGPMNPALAQRRRAR